MADKVETKPAVQEMPPAHETPEQRLLEQIKAAIRDYHWALDMRMNGNLAQTQAFGKVQELLGMPWKQGAEEQRRRRGENYYGKDSDV